MGPYDRCKWNSKSLSTAENKWKTGAITPYLLRSIKYFFTLQKENWLGAHRLKRFGFKQGGG